MRFSDLVLAALRSMVLEDGTVHSAQDVLMNAVMTDYLNGRLTFLDGLSAELQQRALQDLMSDLLSNGSTDDGTNNSSSSSDDSSVDSIASLDILLPEWKEPQTRRRFDSEPPDQSNWYLRYLQSQGHIDNASDRTHPRGREFRSIFGVPYQVFSQLVDLTLDKGWYNNTRVDAMGRRCSDIRLLLLGSLHGMTQNATPLMCQTNTNISLDVHRVFTRLWWKCMSDSRHLFISLPTSEEELQRITEDFEREGIVGCGGSMDVVHRGWDKCPSEYTPLFEGKEGYPTIGFQVISSHRREVLYVSRAFPGTRNDKQIVKVDEAPRDLHSGDSWMSQQLWVCKQPDGTRVFFRGYWFLVDGGYLRWPCLICPVPLDNNEDVRILGKKMESIRKDIECTFGSLKKRFKCLKAWTELRKLEYIEDQFVACCMIHNMLLRYDGYLDPEEEVANPSTPRGDGLWVGEDEENPGAGANHSDVSTADEDEWIRRIEHLAVHYKTTRNTRSSR